jgi:hypothetical protein
MKNIKRFNESRITPPDIDWITDCFSEIIDKNKAFVEMVEIPKRSQIINRNGSITDKFVKVFIEKPVIEENTIRQMGYSKDSEFCKMIEAQKNWSETLEVVDDALTKLNALYPDYEMFFQTHRQSLVISIYAKEY